MAVIPLTLWLTTSAHALQPGAGQAGQASGSAGPATVTLITGDQVQLPSPLRQAPQLLPRAGREKISFTSQRLIDHEGAGHWYVIPDDAFRLINRGKLDRELFNIDTLASMRESGFSARGLPIIITYEDTQSLSRAMAAMSNRATAANSVKTLDVINGLAAIESDRALADFWDGLTAAGTNNKAPAAADNIEKIWLDRVLQPTLEQSVPQIGAPAAREAGYDGSGIIVAVLDSGVDLSHPDLVDVVIEAKNFTEEENTDLHGHGTHVASTIAGSGAASNGRFTGVAPGAKIKSGKVCVLDGCAESWIISGMEWATRESGASIVSISLGGADLPGIDPLEEAVNTLTRETGALFVIAAGNSGPGARTVETPGSADAALTVGAVDKNDHIAEFSSRGPRVGDGSIKPEITAPGVSIVAARALSALGDIGTPVNEYYTELSGTSMATPHVSGAAAILKQRHPDWDAQRLKATLMVSANFDSDLSVFDQGAGRVDVPASLASRVLPGDGVLHLGSAIWPHADDPLIERDITYFNSGETEVTLSLALAVTGPGDQAPPAGMFSLSAETLTIAPQGSAQVLLTADARTEAPDGSYTGRLVANDGTHTINTLLGFYREPESYELTLTHTGADGEPNTDYSTWIISNDNPNHVFTLRTGESETSLRVPKGRYAIISSIDTDGYDRITTAYPDVDFKADQTLTLDASDYTTVELAAPATTDEWFAHHWVHQQFAWGGGVAFLQGKFNESVLQIGSVYDHPATALRSFLQGDWHSYQSGEHQWYTGVWPVDQALADNPLKAMPMEQTAIVKNYLYSPSKPDGSSSLMNWPIVARELGGIYPSGMTLPHEITFYWYSAINDMLGWQGHFYSSYADGTYRLSDPTPRRYQPGNHHNHWGLPPYAPALAHRVRTGNEFTFEIQPHGDSQGHAGRIENANVSFRLYRDDELLQRFDNPSSDKGTITLPPEPASYRLEMDVAQELLPYTTQLSSAWTFASQETGAEASIDTSLMSIRFAPDLNRDGLAVRGEGMEIPVTVTQYDQAAPVCVKTLTVEVSFDDGASWEPVAVRKRSNEQWVAVIDHPGDTGFVSLKSSAEDADGNRVEQTQIRAYGLMD